MTKLFTTKILVPLLFLSLTGLKMQAQIAAWDFFGLNGVATATATTFNANLVAASGANNITRGATAAASAGANSFRTVGFQNNGIAVTNTDYFQITLTAQAGFNLSLSSIDGRLSGTQTFVGTGGVSNQFAYSLDGTTFTLVGSPAVLTGTVPLTLPTINVSGITALQNVAPGTTVTIRYYASGQTSTGGWGFNSNATAGVNGLAIGGSLTAVNPTPTTTSITPSSANAGSGGFPLTVNGTNFINGSSTVTWNAANRTTVFVSSTELTATIPASDILTAGSVLVGVTTTGAAAASNTQTFTINATGGPALSLSSSLTSFGNVCINTTPSANSFTIDGSNLNGTPISINALSGFTYSETLAGTYTNTLSFSYAGNSFTGKIIYVKFSPVAVQSYDGTIDINGGGLAAAYPVAATGSGINNTPTITTGSTSAVTATSATAAGTISNPGCGTLTAYGIEYSTQTGFINGTGTPIASSNLNAGNFTSTISGLIPNTRYFYKAYATSGAGTSYGAEQFFTNEPLPVQMAIQPGLTFAETFADIANWSNFFITGSGANHWDGLSASAGSGIPGSTGVGTTGGTTLTASTSSFQPGTPGTSGGVQKGTDQAAPIPTTQSIILLSTGGTDNTSSAAIDFYMDFTGVNAGTLSFDYQTFSNALGTGANDRSGSLRVYTSTDGITFTELTNVLNFINNAPISGNKTNIPLPASFNNSATARLRFYYHNGTGGTNGSRPKMSIDNLKVTAVATTPCTAPTAAAIALTFGIITDVSIAASFTASSPAADGYIVVKSTSNSLTAGPVNGQIYNLGDNLGDGTVIANGSATSFTATGLTALTTYYFFIFPVNSVCTGGPLYFATALEGNATTVAGLPPCAAPATQATNLIFGTTGINSIQASFTATTADEYLVLRSTAATLTNNPVNAQVYNAGDVLGNAIVVQRNATTTFTANGLAPNTPYYFFVFSLNSQACVNGPVYNVTAPLNGTQTTQPLPPCVTPTAQPTTLNLTAANSAVSGTFTGVASADAYIVVRSLLPTLSATPADNTDYYAGDNFGGGVVVSNSSATSFLATGLTANTTYYFYVFAASKNCSGGTKYATGAPLTASVVTTNAITNSFYFGNLHAHSDYSDGNTDNPGYTPALDYDYAKTAECMDYLGISEHNHFSAEALLSNYRLGINQATTFNSSNPNFLALYGMEWGTIGSGGHALVYGNGMDNLWGWETGSGAWGASNNYDIFVPRGVYTGSTGLFKTTNDNIATNTFVSLAHPGLGDFNNLDAIAYDVAADNAITAVAVESGPSTSSNTTYSNPASSMSYLWYYQILLAKGYHLGPTIDHDNHKTTFGKTTRSRTAIISPSLSKAAIIAAIRNMNFYATQDCDTKVDFTINTKIMGSVFTDRFAPNISVTLTDATTITSGAVIRVMYGVPGSGVMAVKIDSVIGSSLNFTDVNLSNNSTGYYYIDITNGTSRIVTSPVWYTRNDAAAPLPVTLSSFVVQKINNTAKISWSTEQEINSSHFIIERSTDGRTWNAIANVAAAGNSNNRNGYSIFDNAPIKGINYYRLKQVDKDARYEYSAVQKALFNSNYTAEVAPNPAKDFINLYMAKAGNQPATVQVVNAAGKMVYTTSTTQANLQINTAGFSKGLYFVKVIDAENVTTLRVVVQ